MSTLQTKRHVLVQLAFRLVFIVLPTIIISYLTLRALNIQYTDFAAGIKEQAFYFGLGLTIAYILYFFRARFIITFPIVYLLYWLGSLYISRMDGEIDVFQISVFYKLYSTLFLIGWIFGFLLSTPGKVLGFEMQTKKLFYIAVVGMQAVITIIGVSKSLGENDDYWWESFLWGLAPVLVYALYMLFVVPQLVDTNELNFKKSFKLAWRSIAFILLLVLAFFAMIGIDKLVHTPGNRIIGEWSQHGKPGGDGEDGDKKKGGYDERKGLLERGKKGDKDGKGKGGKNPGDEGDGGNKPDDGEDGFKLKDTMKMSDKLSQADYLMFCAKLKNYFPDGSPKPLYFVYHYLTKYDPVKESFIRDTAMPYFDELNVDPSSLAMYRSKMDSTVIKNSLATKKRKSVEAQVYVSSNTWKHALLAPASAYYCQTIPVDSGYKKMFRSAYKVKSYTSELNDAYFVYNPSANPQLESYQEQRFQELRSVTDYSQSDKKFTDYYTQMPKGPLYDSITALAKKITKDADTPIDKVIAIRDFFLQRDKEGTRIFRYTLTPGTPSDPNIPSASMLSTFMFRTHAGYCTYYAGASLFLLRSVGIPSRFTTGFATIDRSDKNKGWYWFYASQAHAWTQVYFPGYGWLDFDMTIGNEDQREAPRPDGTPPLPPPEPWLVLDGKAETAVDLQAKRLDVSFNKLIFFNEDYRLNKTYTRTIDVSVCRVLYGKTDTTLACIQPGDSLIVVSYDDAAKEVPLPKNGMSIEDQLEGFPKPIIADEIHIKPKPSDLEKEQKKKEEKQVNKKEITAGQIWAVIGIVFGGLVIMLFGSPRYWLLWLLLRTKLAKDPKSKADRAYRLGLYHFHMGAGIERTHETPLQYATTKIDPAFNNGFTNFMLVYLRLKYTNGQLMPGDTETINSFAKSIMPSVRRKTGFFKSRWNYLNILRAFRYIRKPEENENEEQQPSL